MSFDTTENGEASAGGWPPERKLRLFACACCRRVWRCLAPACRRAVIAAERYADGQVDVEELAGAWRECRRVERRGQPIPAWGMPAGVQFYQVTEHVHLVAAPVFTPWRAALVPIDLRPWRGDSGENDEADAAHDQLFRDVLGGPLWFPEPNPAWRTPRLREVAARVYRQGRFDALPALADRAERAGCGEAALLDHLRSGEPHARGCWALDRLLGLSVTDSSPHTPPEAGAVPHPSLGMSVEKSGRCAIETTKFKVD